MPSLSQVLSQHEMLESVCASLSSADIVHLSATCKEYQTYLTSSKPISAKLLSNAVCDGTGIVAQARVFGQIRYGGVEGRHHVCLGAAAKPCSECGAKVCNNCRFHLLYPYESARADLDECEEDEMEYAAYLDELWANHGLRTLNLSATHELQAQKGYNMFNHDPWRYYCLQCHPALLSRKPTCRCDIYNALIGHRWLCIPCFFKEEAAVYARGNFLVTYDNRSKQYYHEDLCECGAHPHPESCMICRRCRGWMGGYLGFDQILLPQIYSQLGSNYEERSEAEIDKGMKEIIRQLG